MFFRDSDDDIARRKAENDDRSMFFHFDSVMRMFDSFSLNQIKNRRKLIFYSFLFY